MRTFLIVLLSVIASIGATGLYFKNQDSMVSAPQQETAYDRVIKSGTLRCGYATSPNMLMVDPNTKELSGLNVDVINEIAKELGLKVEWVEEVGWGTFIEGLQTNRYDIFCSQLWPDAGRIKNLSLVGPVVYSFLYPYALADDVRFDGNLARINASDITLPVIDGDISYSMAENGFPKAQKLSLPQMANVSDMMASILTGKADIFFFDAAMINAIPEEQRLKFQRVKNIPSAFTFASYFGVLSGEEQLQDMLQIALDKMVDDGRLEKMARRYSDEYSVPVPRYMRGKDQ